MLSCLELQTQAGGWAKPQETPLGLGREINCLALPSPKLSAGATGAVITGPPPAEGTPPSRGHVVLEDLPGPSPLTSHRPSCSFSSPPGGPPKLRPLTWQLLWPGMLAWPWLSSLPPRLSCHPGLCAEVTPEGHLQLRSHWDQVGNSLVYPTPPHPVPCTTEPHGLILSSLGECQRFSPCLGLGTQQLLKSAH